MSLRDQIYERILNNNLAMEIRLNGQIIDIKLPRIEREYRVSQNVRKVDERMKARAQELADEQMKLLFS